MTTLYVSTILAAAFSMCINMDIHAKSEATVRDSVQTVQAAKLLLSRLDEINAMDKSGLTASETKVFRKEVRLIKSELKELHKATYLSVGKLVVLLMVPFVIFNVSQ